MPLPTRSTPAIANGAVLAHLWSHRPEGSREGVPMNHEISGDPVFLPAFSPTCPLHSALLGILQLLPSRIPILSSQATIPGLNALKTGFIFENILGLQAASQGPQDPDGLLSPQNAGRLPASYSNLWVLAKFCKPT